MFSLSKFSTSRREEERKRNIAKFMEGLFEGEDVHVISSQDKKKNGRRKFETMRRQYGQRIRDMFNWMTKIWRPLFERISDLRMRSKNKRQLTELRKTLVDRLPEQELECYSKYPEVLEQEKENLLTVPFSIYCIHHSDLLMEIYTGFPNAPRFFYLVASFRKERIKYSMGWVVGQLTIKQQILMTLMKLRLNFTDVHLSLRFQCSLDTVTNTITTWISAMHRMFYDPMVSVYGRVWSRTCRRLVHREPCIIIHEKEVKLEPPKDRNDQVLHKSVKEPRKAVIGCIPDGPITFSSRLYPWTKSFESIVKKSKALASLKKGDRFIHFRPQDPKVPYGVIPLKRQIENPGVFGEVMVESLKSLDKYQILNSFPPSLEGKIDTVFKVCVILSNFSHTFYFGNAVQHHNMYRNSIYL